MGVRRRVIVIGAGIAGLTAAALLSSRHDVVVYERAARPGGKVHATPSSLGPIDSGPTVFTMAWVFEKIFAEAGGAFRERVELQRLEVLARHYWRDGSKLDLFADPARTRDAIRDFAGPAESRRFEAFERRTRALFDGLLEPFMMASDPSLPRLIGSRNPFGLLRISPFQTLWRFLETQFKDPRLRQLFGRYATYCGASPFAAPATLALIANVEQQGVWTLTGGMSALADALEALGRTQGAEFVYDAHVSEILTQRRGVRLASGERREADAIVFNGDVAALRAGDAGPHAANAVEPAAEAEPSQSAMTWSTTGEADGVDLS
ncbi:MAG: FAD-dependent oxidoreductase, partial [Pseudomonadota bacterium]